MTSRASRARPHQPGRPIVARPASQLLGAITGKFLGAIALLALTLLAYAPALGAGFIWDDDAYVTANPTLRTLDGLRRIWLEPSALPQYYPLVHTTFWIERHLWGLDPFGYHLVNVLLHAASALVFWRLLRRLGIPGAWWAGALFALHPMQVESVAWITERKNTLSGLFYLLAGSALLAGLGGGTEHRGRKAGQDARMARVPGALSSPTGLVIAGGLFFVCALLSKSVTATLPLGVVIVLWWQAGRIARRAVIVLAPLLGLGALSGFATAWLEVHHVGAVGLEWTLTWPERAILAGRAVVFYLGKLLWPSPLIFFYPRWTLDTHAVAQILAPAAVLVGFLVILFARPRIGRAPLAAAALFVLTLAPALGFFDLFPMRYSFVADHFAYLATLAPIALFCASLSGLARLGGIGDGVPSARNSRNAIATGRRGVSPYVAIMVCVAGTLGVLTWRHARAFHDPETLWRDTLAKNPDAWAAHDNLGLILARRGDTQGAIAHYREALRLSPSAVETRNNHGTLLYRLGRTEEAAGEFAEAVRLRPDYGLAQLNLGTALLKLRRPEEAIAPFEAALRREPDLVTAHEKLALALRMSGREAEAAVHDVEAMRLRAWVLATHEDPAVRNGAMALDLVTKALAAAPAPTPQLLDTLAAAQAESGRFDEAEATAARALELIHSTGLGGTARGGVTGDTVIGAGTGAKSGAGSVAEPDKARDSDAALVEAIELRRRLYAAGRPYRDPLVSRIAVTASSSPSQ